MDSVKLLGLCRCVQLPGLSNSTVSSYLDCLESVQIPGLFLKCPATWTVSSYLDGVHNDVHVEVEGGHGHQVNHQKEGGEEQLRGRPPTVRKSTSSGKVKQTR
jgi:hypothetical protein